VTTALYRRYRPDTFDQVIGQDHVTVPLRAALRANRVTHAYLFSGPRGCGKTTSARILARCLNCADGPTDTPCGHCDSCQELATGGPGSLDVVEMDAASHGGVDDARDLRERAAFAPVRDRYKVFIIDEAHMVTTQGFNALLKLVEEPPEHVKFIFATTEPEKVIGTIRSRTHHYPFRLVPPDVLEPFLRTICDQEGITVGDGVLNLVIRAGGGSVRDTLSVLDQLMAGTVDARLDYPTTVALLGYTDTALLDQTVDALAGGDGAAAYRVVERMVESGHEPRRFAEDLLQRLRDLLIIAVAGDGADDVLAGTPSDQLERMKVQARNWGPGPLSRAADLTDQALRGMMGATSPRLQLELLIGRILVPEPGQMTAGPGDAVGAGSGAAGYPGTVGLAGGGAPRGPGSGPFRSPGDNAGAADREGFGAAQAREHLRRSRTGNGGGAQTTPPSGAEPGGNSGSAPAPTAPRTETPDPRGHPADETVTGRPSTDGPDGSHSARASGAPTAVTPTSSVGVPSLPGWDEPVAAVPGTSSDQQTQTLSTGSGTPTSAAPTESSQGAPRQEPGSVTGRDADMLRDRWTEVIQRLSSISRATWSLVDQNGQLGGVDGSSAVIVFPTAGLVGAFVNGNRGPDLERAIQEATGLTLSVCAQVGQAGGGGPVTTPTAVATRPQGGGPRAQEQQQASTAREHRPEPQRPGPDRPDPPGQNRPSDSVRSDAAWPDATRPGAPAESPLRPTSGPASPSAAAEPVRDDQADHPPTAVMTAPADPDAAQGSRALPSPASGEAADALMPLPARSPSSSAPARASSSPTSPDPAPPAGTWTSGWTETVVAIPGSPSAGSAAGAAVADRVAPVFEDDLDTDAVTDSRPPTSRRRTANPAAGSPSSQGTEGDRRTDRPAAPAVAAAQDTSASIDDADVASSTLIGLPAVLEILGGAVVEEIDHKED